ncbi:MAG: hypothetical protein H0U76_22400 [Ktedonobacteraceae bacterium]|nr:hypothetical protein [Ktedonobacteraceae bacterium]
MTPTQEDGHDGDSRNLFRRPHAFCKSYCCALQRTSAGDALVSHREKPSAITNITTVTRRAAQPVTYLCDGLYRGADGRRYRLLEGGSTKPAFFQSEPVPPPVQRGRQLPLRWQSGRWEKHTCQGWKIA